MSRPPANPAILDRLPEELAALPFGSPEFKDMNAKIGQEDEDACAPISRAMPSWINLTGHDGGAPLHKVLHRVHD